MGLVCRATKAVRGNGKALAHYKKWLGCNEPRFSSRMSCPFLNARYTKSEFNNVTNRKEEKFSNVEDVNGRPMATNPAFFRDLAYVFLAAFAGGLLAWRLRLPVIIGYILAGVLISPFTPGPSVSDVHTLELFAEIGVILLMFSIGLEFSVKELMRARWVALLGGPIGIVLSIGMGFVTGRLLGWTDGQGLVVGAIVSVASVGPNRSGSVPEYFSRINCSTFRRNFSGFARFELLPALRCCSPLAPSSRYRCHSLFVWR